jgi:hypothetical protein
MKHIIHKLRIGDQVWAQIVERVSSTEFIVSFYGDLIRIRNESPNSFVAGDKVLVRAVTLSPLTFRLVPATETTRGANRLNVSI